MGAKLTIGDKVYDIDVCEIEFTSDVESYGSWGGNRTVMYGRQKLELSANINSIEILNKIKEEAEMAYSDEKGCDSESFEDYNGESLARKLVELELSEEDVLLRKHGILNLDGTVTAKGKTFLLNLLFEENKEAVVEALHLIEEADEMKS